MASGRATLAMAFILCASIFTRSSLAGLAADITRSAVSANGKFVLVHISADTIDIELQHAFLDASERSGVSRLRAKYPCGGLYKNDGSTIPLWTYDGSWGADPIIAPDGKHVVFERQWTFDEEGYGYSVVDFTECGQLIRSCNIFDVFPTPQYVFRSILNGLSPPVCSSTSFDADTYTYTVSTNQREQFTFDVKTGEIIAVQSLFPKVFALTIGVIGAAIVAVVIWWRKSRIQDAP